MDINEAALAHLEGVFRKFDHVVRHHVKAFGCLVIDQKVMAVFLVVRTRRPVSYTHLDVYKRQWLYYNFCGWLNLLNCTLPPFVMILVLADFMNKEDFETEQPKLKTIDWFAVAGVILCAIVANLLHWGIASINGMVVAAVCYCVGQAVNKRK